jgi:hypothetical protein
MNTTVLHMIGMTSEQVTGAGLTPTGRVIEDCSDFSPRTRKRVQRPRWRLIAASSSVRFAGCPCHRTFPLPFSNTTVG